MRTLGIVAQRWALIKRRQVAVVVVGRDIELIALGQVSDLLGLREAVPRHVDHGDIERVLLEVGTVTAQGVEVLARADTRGGGLLDLQQRVRVIQVDFQPQQVERLQRLGDAQTASVLKLKFRSRQRSTSGPTARGTCR